MEILFDRYRFRFWMFTTTNRYELAEFVLTATADGLQAQCEGPTLDDGSTPVGGLLEVRFARRERGISWQACAVHEEA